MNNIIISNGGTFSGGTISSGDTLTINSGASTVSTTTVDGGQENVFGSATDTTVRNGGMLTVSSGGTAFDTTVANGGVAVVSSAGSLQSTTVLNGGSLALFGSAGDITVDSGGVAFINPHASAATITVGSGGIVVVSASTSDTSATSVTVDGGGYLVLTPGPGTVGPISNSGGTVVSSGVAIIQPGGSIAVFNSSVTNTTINSGAIELVLPNGEDLGGTINSGGEQQVFSGGSALGAVLSHGIQVVDSSASASATMIDQGAAEYVKAMASVVGSIINSGGFLIEDQNGTTTGVIANNGGVEVADGTVSSSIINNGGAEYVLAAGTDDTTIVNNGGAAYIYGVTNGTSVDSGGFLSIEGGGLGSSIAVDGGELFEAGGQETASGFLPGAVVSDTTVSSGGLVVVFTGATDDNTTISSGGTLVELQGAKVSGLNNAGGTLVSTGIVLISGSAVTLNSAAVDGLTVSGGVTDYILNGGTQTLTTIDNHAAAEVDSGGTAIDTIIEGGGTLSVDSGGNATGSITFAGSGGKLVVNTSTTPGAVISGFDPGDTIDFPVLQGGSIAPTVSLAANNLLVVVSSGVSARVQLDPGHDYSQNGFNVTMTPDGPEVSVTPTSSNTVTSSNPDVVPVQIPLYVMPYNNSYKLGIEVSLNGGVTYNMYEFDTGGTGFYAAYSPSSWGSFTPLSNAPVVNTYVSGISYTAQVVSTNVTFQTTTGTTLTANNADVGLITTASGAISPQTWNSDLTSTPSTPPLEDNFYGDFGMSLTSQNGLAAILAQLPGGMSNGFIINIGNYPSGTNGQIGSVQVGLTPADIAQFTTIIPMQGQNTLNPYAMSGEPTYGESLAQGSLSLNGTTVAMNTPFIFDTGATGMLIFPGQTLTPADLQPFSTGSQITSGTTITTSATASPGNSDWQQTYTADDPTESSHANVDTFSTERSGSVNTGINAFFGYRVMFDLADGIIGFQSLACFAAGTRIATPRGDVAVERLQAGDAVLTISGAARPIVWVGRRTVECRSHPRPHSVLPVRIKAHAFGPGLPKRDLYLSPDHALFLEDVLIPVKHLLNGSTVAPVRRARVDYYHIELARHDVVLAEGLAAETYLDIGDRSAFANGGQVVQAHPAFEPGSYLLWETRGYAPLAVTGPAVDRAKRCLVRHATAQDVRQRRAGKR